VPGLIAVIVMLIAALLTSLTVAREWETGTMEQLISTPIRGPELILGKLAPYFAIGVLDTVLAMLAGYFLFDVPMRGSLLLLACMSAVYIVGALSLGILISTLAKGQLLASQMAFTATFLPAFLLSGFMFDIANMPTALQLVTYLVPARYFVTILRGLYLKGVGLSVLWPECLLLTVFGVLMLFLSMRVFKKRLV
jgi:ABC-2 type transport system permease protein